MELLESKSLLAKLMATENLVVEQRKVPTAMFDVKNRILVIPVLDEKIDGFTYDLFVGHEVGHALYTPMDGMIKAREEKVNASILNVVEDSRIERKIKHKYPGLRNSFTKAYKSLVEKDFFGTNGVDLNEMNFIDRVNMHCKGGAMLGIKFDAEEKVLLDAVETTQTYDEVIEVAKRIHAFMKEKEEERKANSQPDEDFEEKDEDENFDGFGNWDDDADFDEEGEEQDQDENTQSSSTDSNEGDEDKNEDDEIINGNEQFQHEEIEDDKVRSYTDDAFKQNEKKLFAESATNYLYANVPEFDINKGILGYKALYKKYKEHSSQWGDGQNDYGAKQYQKLRKETNKVVSYLVKEFELRKNADQLKRASTAKTGELDMKKIFSYQFSEDIFRKISVVPNGKSHGLVMFLDWSGSMSDHIENTVKQLLSLVMFCKKVNIPYEVYSFATPESVYSHDYMITPKDGDLETRRFYLMNLLSSKMSAGEFTYAASCLVRWSLSPRYIPGWMCMCGTPLNEATIAAMEIVPHFQKRYKLQIVNAVFLTDGEGHTIRNKYETHAESGKLVTRGHEYSYGSKADLGMIIRDPKTKHQEKIENIYNCASHTSAYVKLLKSRTNCNVLGFYVLSGREFNRKMYDFFPRTSDFEKIKVTFRKNKFAVVETAGFDEYYVLRSEALDTDENNTFEVKENATTRGLVSAFSKYAGGRVANRVVLNRFIGMIS
jgi:hypothetical protein